MDSTHTNPFTFSVSYSLSSPSPSAGIRGFFQMLVQWR